MTTAPHRELSAPNPAFSADELALLLGLPLERAQELANGGAFTGPSGLTCQVLMEGGMGAGASAHPSVKLGLRANQLAGDDVQRLLVLQGRLLANGLWYLGTSPDGDLQIVSLHSFETARDLAAALDVANIVALSTLRLLLQNDAAGRTAAPAKAPQ
jgi:hypothetical protein